MFMLAYNNFNNNESGFESNFNEIRDEELRVVWMQILMINLTERMLIISNAYWKRCLMSQYLRDPSCWMAH